MSFVEAEPLSKIALQLSRAERPVLHVGPAARNVAGFILELAHIIGAAIFTTPDAKSLFDERQAYCAGVFSFGANAFTTRLSQDCDVVLALGTELGEFASLGGKAFQQALLLQIVDRPAALATALCPAIALVAELQCAVSDLIARCTERAAKRDDSTSPAWFERRRHFTSLSSSVQPDDQSSDSREARARRTHAISPHAAMRAIQATLPAKARVACDVTSAALHLLQTLKLGPERRLWIQLEKSACMGSALAVGLGLKLASGLPTLVVIGDWGLMMALAELHTVASVPTGPFVVLVWSNAGGALIRSGVQAQGIDVPVETHSFVSPRFEWMARGVGLSALSVCTQRGLRRALGAAFSAAYPVLIDATIQPDAVIPGAEARYLHLTNSSAA